MAWPVAIAIGVWWTANTVSHAFIHRRFFRSPAANAGTAACLTLVMGVPLPLWRERHLAHHAGAVHDLRLSRELAIHLAFVIALWTAIAVRAPWFFATAYLPGYVAGLLLCAVHGHYEHAGATTSHYGRVYNFVCFNDGYHVEHHRYPGLSWRTLPAVREPGAASSAWPAPLRWIEGIVTAGLNFLERIVLSSPPLQRFVLRAHERAFRMVLGVRNAEIAEIAENENHSPRLEYRRAGLCTSDEHFLAQRTLRALRSDAAVAIIGGGLFPRTALVVRRLLPHARITIVDQSGGNLARAGVFLRDHSVTLLHQRYTAHQPPDDTYDIVVFPLAFRGDRNAIYAHPPAPVTIVHDWIWRPRGVSCVVSAALLKRVNLLRR